MLRLRNQVGSNELRISFLTDDDNLGWSGQHVNGAIEAHKLLRSSYKCISRSHNLVYPCNGVGAVRQGRDSLRASATIHLRNAQ